MASSNMVKVCDIRKARSKDERKRSALVHLKALGTFREHYVGLGQDLVEETLQRIADAHISPAPGDGLRLAQIILFEWRSTDRVELPQSVNARNLIGAYALTVLAPDHGIDVLPDSWAGVKQLASHAVAIATDTLDAGFKNDAAIKTVERLQEATSTEIQKALARPAKKRDESKALANMLKKMIAEHGYSIDDLADILTQVESEIEHPAAEEATEPATDHASNGHPVVA